MRGMRSLIYNQAITVVDDLARDVLLLFIVRFDSDLELVASGLTVFAVVVSGLDEELNRLVYGHVFHETTSETERVNGSRYKALVLRKKHFLEAEVAPGSGEVLVANGKLDNAVLGSMDRVVRGLAVNLGVTDVSSTHID